MKHLLATFVFFFLSACAVVKPVFYQYEGPPRQHAEEAIVYFTDADRLLVRFLDGQELADPYTTWNGGWGAVREIHMLPGQHTLQGHAWRGSASAPFTINASFKAGERYRLTSKLVGFKLGVELVKE